MNPQQKYTSITPVIHLNPSQTKHITENLIPNQMNMEPKLQSHVRTKLSSQIWIWRLLALSILSLTPFHFYVSMLILSQPPPQNLNLQSRFDRNSWIYPRTTTPILPRDMQGNRAFMSSLWTHCLEGLGHRLGMINFELLMAHELNVGYVHRRGTYGSLTPKDDPFAVERLFGWDVAETRDEVLKKSCEILVSDNTGCEGERKKRIGGPVCRQLKRVQDGGLFKHLVEIPSELIDCYIEGKSPSKCGVDLRKFAKKYGENDTMFQMVPGKCSPDYRVPWFENTRGWLLDKYWEFHKRNERGTLGMLKGKNGTREIVFDEKRVQVAVHVRRGDFMNFTDRVMIEDERYAEIVVRLKRIIDRRFGKNVGVDMHVYSEGVPKNGWYSNNHDTKKMLPVYVTEKGEKKEDAHAHWEMVLGRLIRRRGIWIEDLKLFTHIASDTVTAIHEMISANFFVGSLSGMSIQLVNIYSRGFVILPTTRLELPKSDGRVMWYHAKDVHEEPVRSRDIEKSVNYFADRYEYEFLH